MKITKIFSSLLRKFGFEILRHHPECMWVSQPKGYHVTFDYMGRSIKKQQDIRELQPFGRLATKVIQDNRTCLYYDRLHTIFQCLSNVPKLNEKNLDVAEVGVFQGGGSYFIASVLQELGLNDVTLHMFDTFDGHAVKDISSSEDNTDVHTEHKFTDTSFEGVKEYISKFSSANIYKGRIQENAHLIESTRFAFVHLDMDLYDPTMFGLDFFEYKLCSGGMILLDDFGRTTCPGIRKAVDTFLENRNTFTRIDLLSAQCLLIRK